MKFICTSKGFLVGRSVTKGANGQPNGMETLYSPRIREAKVFNKTSTAVRYMERNNIEGFIFSPMKEEPCRDLYKVEPPQSRVNDFWVISEAEQRRRSVYHIEKVMMCHYSDLDFINGVEHPTEKYFTYDQALEVCREKNQELIDAIMEDGTFENVY